MSTYVPRQSNLMHRDEIDRFGSLPSFHLPILAIPNVIL